MFIQCVRNGITDLSIINGGSLLSLGGCFVEINIQKSYCNEARRLNEFPSRQNQQIPGPIMICTSQEK